jgi:hypothetical protein
MEEQEHKEEQKEPEQEYEYYLDGDLAEILFSLLAVYEKVNDIDVAILGKVKAKQVENWKEIIWKTTNTYMKILGEQE